MNPLQHLIDALEPVGAPGARIPDDEAGTVDRHGQVGASLTHRAFASNLDHS